MSEIIFKLTSVLNEIKGFIVGSTSGCSNKMLVDYKESRYVITITKIKDISFDNEEEQIQDAFKDIQEYLK